MQANFQGISEVSIDATLKVQLQPLQPRGSIPGCAKMNNLIELSGKSIMAVRI